jgi:hypothetical protein
MNRSTANFLLIAGLILTFGAVGGIETSTDDNSLLASMLLAIVSLGTMYCGLLAHRVLDSQGE